MNKKSNLEKCLKELLYKLSYNLEKNNIESIKKKH